MPRWTPENRPSIDTSKPATTGLGDRDLQLLIESLSSGLLFFSLSPNRVLAVRMWESRVLGEISKALWKPFLWFPWGCHLHRHLRHRPRSSRSRGMLYPCRRADRRSSRLLRGCLGSADRSNRSETVQPPRCHARPMVLLRRVLGAQVGVDLGAPAAWSALEHMGVME